MSTYTILTSGPCITKRETTLAEVKSYVEAHAPLKRGWTGEWIRKNGRHYFIRSNSKGRVLPGYSICVKAGEL